MTLKLCRLKNIIYSNTVLSLIKFAPIIALFSVSINAESQNCDLEFSPENIDSAAYRQSIATRERLRNEKSNIYDVSLRMRQDCEGMNDSDAKNSCRNSFVSLNSRLGLINDSITLLADQDYKHANQISADPNCYIIDRSNPLSIIFAKSGFGEVYSGIEVSSDSILTRLDKKHTKIAEREILITYPVFRKRLTQHDIELILDAIDSSRILRFDYYYGNDIFDGTQWKFVISQHGWVKRVILSNYHPKEAEYLVSILKGIASSAKEISNDSAGIRDYFNAQMQVFNRKNHKSANSTETSDSDAAINNKKSNER